MKRSNRWGTVAVLAAPLLLIAAGAAATDDWPTGNVYGWVIDEAGAALPGVPVTLETAAGPQVRVTDARGRFSFLDLPPAKQMTIRFELQGYGPTEYKKIVVTAGRNTTLEVTMFTAVEVDPYFGPSTLLEERAHGSITIIQEELQGIPTSREPWTLLQAVPGVQLDRINIGGRENSRQPAYAGPGANGASSSWAIDGTVVTDMAALGSLSSTYDFDALEEVQITTGETDAAVATAGVAVNLVTKRAHDEWRGSARYLNAPSRAQSHTSFSRGPLALGESALPNAFDQVRGIDELGGEAGGPAVKDILWLWGAYGNQKLSAVAAGASPTVRSCRLTAAGSARGSGTPTAWNSSPSRTARRFPAATPARCVRSQPPGTSAGPAPNRLSRGSRRATSSLVRST
ncbi:MAG TPA: carboxypeptidase-like regulatory domain-containing protein [Thermoanaerobaculia bacterium]|nr:carboxypeptidase-like regulatory domain-containing protein [Thermoanaerobaculia bacterium]